MPHNMYMRMYMHMYMLFDRLSCRHNREMDEAHMIKKEVRSQIQSTKGKAPLCLSEPDDENFGKASTNREFLRDTTQNVLTVLALCSTSVYVHGSRSQQ